MILPYNSMPTSKRARKETNPLTLLRQQLGSNGRPLSVSKLAALVGVPSATLRSVQLGRRTLNPDLQRRLHWRGVQWVPQSGHWVFTFHHGTPLSLALLES